MLRVSAVSLAILCAASSSLFAADIYRRDQGSYKDTPIYVAPHLWQGFYIGANVGYGWADKDSADIDVLGPPNSIYPLSASYSTDYEGVFGGLQAGYNFQSGKFVFGIEADILAADFSADSEAVDPFAVNPPSVLDTEFSIDWFGTVRGRLGVAYDRALLFATGGLAYGHVNLDAAYTTPLTTVRLGSDDTEIGYAVGGGLEYAIGSGWTLKAEYLYVDLGEVDGSATFFDETYKTEADASFHTVRVGLNYVFGGRHDALK